MRARARARPKTMAPFRQATSDPQAPLPDRRDAQRRVHRRQEENLFTQSRGARGDAERPARVAPSTQMHQVEEQAPDVRSCEASLRLCISLRLCVKQQPSRPERTSQECLSGTGASGPFRVFTYAHYPRYPQAESAWCDSGIMTASGRGRDDRPAAVESLPSHSRSEAASCPTRQSRQRSEGPGG